MTKLSNGFLSLKLQFLLIFSSTEMTVGKMSCHPSTLRPGWSSASTRRRTVNATSTRRPSWTCSTSWSASTSRPPVSFKDISSPCDRRPFELWFLNGTWPEKSGNFGSFKYSFRAGRNTNITISHVKIIVMQKWRALSNICKVYFKFWH
jgi:hypothetical protein